VDAQLALPCGCCTPPTVPPKTTNTHHYSILVHILHATTTLEIIFISLLPNLFFFTYIPHYYPLTFQLISSPSGHHKFNFDYNLFFLKIKTHFMRARKQIIPLIWLNFAVLSTWPNLPTGVAAWPLLSFLFVSGVLGLQIRRGQIRWKANTPNYTSMRGPSLNSAVFRSKIPPGNRATNLPCFANGESISNSS